MTEYKILFAAFCNFVLSVTLMVVCIWMFFTPLWAVGILLWTIGGVVVKTFGDIIKEWDNAWAWEQYKPDRYRITETQ